MTVLEIFLIIINSILLVWVVFMSVYLYEHSKTFSLSEEILNDVVERQTKQMGWINHANERLLMFGDSLNALMKERK